MPNGRDGFVIIETLEITYDECTDQKVISTSTQTTQPSTTTVTPSPAAETIVVTDSNTVKADDSPRVRRRAARGIGIKNISLYI
jgi:hypothetical protein